MRPAKNPRAAAHDLREHPDLAKPHKPRTPWSWVKGSAGEMKNYERVVGDIHGSYYSHDLVEAAEASRVEV